MILLREIVLQSGLKEELKWKQACYTLNGKNLLIISSFKAHCAINFFKGSLIQDTENLLTQPGENTKWSKQMRFTSTQEIENNSATIKDYLKQAMEIETSGKVIEYIKLEDLEIPTELTDFFEKDRAFQIAFESLTPGRQKVYIMFIAAAKQSTTRTTRIKKFIPRILNGKGMYDCVCGHSQRMPSCDGSHKYF